MKKLILTGCAAALFAIGAIAQVQDTVNNNLRQGAQETQEEAQDAGNELRDRTQQTGEEIKDDAQDAGNELRQGAEETGNDIQQGAEQTGDQIKDGAQDVKDDAKDAGNELRQGAEETGNEIEQGAERTGDQIEQGAENAKDELNQDSPSSENSQDPNATGTGNSMGATAQPQHEIEVLEDKEGPNNQVIYKYQGELYYVDRDQKQLVQIEESQLKDAEHAATISGDDQKDNN